MRHPDVPFYLQVGNDAPGQGMTPRPLALLEKLLWLQEKILADRFYKARPAPAAHAAAGAKRVQTSLSGAPCVAIIGTGPALSRRVA